MKKMSFKEMSPNYFLAAIILLLSSLHSCTTPSQCFLFFNFFFSFSHNRIFQQLATSTRDCFMLSKCVYLTFFVYCCAEYNVVVVFPCLYKKMNIFMCILKIDSINYVQKKDVQVIFFVLQNLTLNHFLNPKKNIK